MSDHEMHQAAQAAQAAGEAASRHAQDMMGTAQSMMDPAKMSETLRAMTQTSMEQSKEAYARMKSAADEATKTLESTMENAHQGSLSLSKTAIDAMRSNAEAGFGHLERLMGAKSFSEVIEMQTAYVRKQIELATDQTKDMQSLAQSVAQELMKPGRDAFPEGRRDRQARLTDRRLARSNATGAQAGRPVSRREMPPRALVPCAAAERI